MTREEAIDIMKVVIHMLDDDYDDRVEIAIQMAIEALQAEPVKHGEWVRLEIKDIINPLTGENRTYIGCSCCGEPIPTDSILDIIPEEEVNFCFGCGAKMDKEIEDDGR